MFNLWATKILNAAYTATGFPVAYWKAQLSLDHAMRSSRVGTGPFKAIRPFSLYIHTQLIDFIFIASVLILHTAALLALARALPAQSKARHALVWAALLSTIAPLADAIENGISFMMLANPTGFEPFLAIAYSTVAAVKFGMFAFAKYVAAAIGLVAALDILSNASTARRE